MSLILNPLYPLLKVKWHSVKNGNLKLVDVSQHSKKSAWWECDKGHEWEATISNCTRGSGCPYCTDKKIIVGYNDFASQNPELASEWHPTKNGELKPEQVTAKTGIKVWWECDKGHGYESLIRNRINGIACPYCSGRQVFQGYNDLPTINPELVTQWHPTKNGELKPESFSIGSSKKVWWLCSKGHEWEAVICNRHGRKTGCPICKGKQILIGYNDLASQNPELASEWHPTRNSNLTTQQTTTTASRKVWWLGSCKHEWEAVILSRTNGANCPLCESKKVITECNSLELSNSILASEWHPTKNNEIVPNDIAISSNEKVWWLCDKGHEWEAAISSRTNGASCPECSLLVSQPEKEIFIYLDTLGLIMEKPSRTLLKDREFDLYFPEKKIAIEFNNIYWHTENNGKDSKYHYNKWLACKNQDIQLIQIWGDDWERNKAIILKGLAHKLGATTQEKIYARKTKNITLNTNQARDFMENNHIQGFASGTYYIGLEDTNNMLQAVIILKKEGNNTFNIIRYATAANVIGGFTKLLTYATKTYKPSDFITFADHCISNGGLYENNGFVADKEIPPDYMYLVRNKRKHKFGYRLKKFRNEPTLIWEEGLSEKELAKLNNIPRIWDAGKTRYVLKIDDTIKTQEEKKL